MSAGRWLASLTAVLGLLLFTASGNAQTIQTYAGGGTCGSVAGGTDSMQPIGVAADSSGNVFVTDVNHYVVCRIAATTGNITTVAGNGFSGYSGDGGAATSAQLGSPYGVAVDAAGNLYIADGGNNVIRRVDAITGIITTVVGNETAGYSGDGGAATAAELNEPYGVAVDAAGDLYIADLGNNRIREVNAATGIITTVAGKGAYGYSGDGGLATAAELNEPSGVAIDAAGDLYIADLVNNRVREVNATTRIITTVAGNGTAGYSGDGGAATAAELYGPIGVAVDAAGNLYITDTTNQRVREVNASTGVITTVAGNGTYGYGGDGGAATAAELGDPTTVALDGVGNLYIADLGNSRVREVNATTGIITTVAGNGYYNYAGDGGAATSAQLASPYGVAVDAAGNLFIADVENNVIRRVDAITGIITTVAGNGTAGYSGDGGAATAAELYEPFGVAVDAAGDLYIADLVNNRIREVNAATGIITTVAGNGTAGYSGDGGAATAAELYEPFGVAVDAAGDLYIADLVNSRVREVNATTGIITTVAGNGTSGYSGDGGAAIAAELSEPTAVAVDAAGNLYIADAGNNVIRRVDAITGVITTVAGNGTEGYSGDGGAATAAELYEPLGVAVDGAGNLYIADTSNYRVREASAATGIITTVAGNGTYGYAGDGGPSTSAEFASPYGVVTGANGNLYVSDLGNDRVRVVPGIAVGNSSVPPTVTPTVTGTLGTSGWYTSTVSVSWTVNGTEITAQNGCGSTTILSDTTGQTLTCSATNAAGTTSKSVTIKRDATPPVAAATASPMPDAYGWDNSTVTVTFSGTDATSGIASCSQPVTVSAQGANQTSPSGTCTDNAGNVSAPVSVSGINIDATPPVVMGAITAGIAGNNGWYVSPVTVTFAGFDALSGVAPGSCSVVTLSSDGANQTAPGSCADLANNVGNSAVTGINIDQTPPVAAATAVPPPNANGWNNSTVTVTFSGADPISGIASCSPTDVLSMQGSAQVASGTCQDVAGNVSAPVTDTVNIDLTAPLVSIFTPVPNDGFVLGETHATSYSCADALSGVATCTGTVASGQAINTGTLGPQAFTVSSSDLAGNTASQANNYTVNPAGTVIVTTIAGNGASGYAGDGGPSPNAELTTEQGVALDSVGNIYIADSGNQRVRMIGAATGLITTIAGNGNAGYSGDGGPATSASLFIPTSVAVDGLGNLYIADAENNRIREVSVTTGNISTAAGNGTAGYSGDGGAAGSASLNNPYGIALDGSGNLYIADANNNRVRMVASGTGIISTVAGTGIPGYRGDAGVATAAELNSPLAVAVDLAGNIFIADEANARIRRIDAITGVITTVAGNGTFGYSGDGGAATSASLNQPTGVSIDASGNLLIADNGNNRIRLVQPSGVISTVAGTGTAGWSGDGGPAITGAINGPYGLASPGNGSSYVADSSNNRVRHIRDTTYTLAPIAIFGGQPVGSPTAAMPVTLTNLGVAAVSIKSIALSGTNANQFSQTNNCGASVLAGSSCVIEVTFKPTSAGEKLAAVGVTGNTGTPTKYATLSGVGGSVYTLAPRAVGYGSEPEGTSSAAGQLTLTNTGTTALTIGSVSLTSTNANQFSQTNNCGSSVAVGGTCTISVTFKPTSAGAKSALLTVKSTGSVGTEYALVTGSGTVPAYTLSTTTLTFASDGVGVPSSPLPVTVTNTGSLALPVTSITLSGSGASQFSQTNNCGSSLAAGSTCTINVVFTPTTAGSKSATLTVKAGGGAGNQTVTITGTGIVPTYTVMPLSLAFGNQTHKTSSAPVPVTLTNTGTFALPIKSMAFGGSNPGQFSETNNCGTSLAGGAYCTINVVFSPTTTGAKSATLKVTPGGGAAAETVDLSGTGT